MATPMQVCMETSDWLKAMVPEDGGMDSSSPSSEMISCVRPPMLERRLRPPHDQPLKCPRCDSTHTKFCYYNNYSLSQPRYFCKTCRRYWTKGGSLRNVPVGGGCRKNKRSSSKKLPSADQQPASHQHQHQHQPTDLHLSFPSTTEAPNNLNFMLDGPENKFGAMLGIGSRSHLFMGGCEIGLGDSGFGFSAPSSFHHGLSPIGYDGGHMAFADACQRLALPFDGQEEGNAGEVKPSSRMLSLEWPEQGCGVNSFGYSNGLGLWTGMVNGQGSSAAI